MRLRTSLPAHDVALDARGVWYCRPYLGATPAGKPIQPYRSFPAATTREDAQRLADTWVASLTADGRVASTRLSDLLADYIDMRERNGASPNTIRVWRLFSRRYIVPLLGPKPAQDIDVVDLNHLQTDLLRAGGAAGQSLDASTVRSVYHFLHGAWVHFVASGVCDTNPTTFMAKVSPTHHEVAALGEYDFSTIANAITSELDLDVSHHPNIVSVSMAMSAWMALHTGMRVGEVCALRRRDVVRTASYVHVGGTAIEMQGCVTRRDVTKGKRPRNISLTASELDTITSYMRLQDKTLDRRLSGSSPLITADGSIMRPTSVSRAFGRMAHRLGLPKDVTFHSLRHTHATWCLMAGVDIKTLSERLGHADEATTLRYYGHVLPGRDAQAAQAFEDKTAQFM